MTDLMANYIMHGCPGVTGETASSPTVQESEDIICGHPGATGEIVPSSAIQGSEDVNMSKVKTRRFKRCAKPPKHKDPNELHLRVSCISTNRPCCLNITTG